MTPKERYDKLWEEAHKPLPNYKDVIRQTWLEAFRDVKEKPVLDLFDESC
ncbi:hypothetical protein ES702_05814 [subsurface metagenome]